MDYRPLEAKEITALVHSRLPLHFPEVAPESRADWSVLGPAFVVRMSTATDALFTLSPDDSWLAAEALARTAIEVTITFAWLAARPDENVPEWVGGNDLERLKADNKHKHWLPEAGYGEGEPEGLLSAEAPEAAQESAAKMLALGDRAKAADAEWRPRIPALQNEGCSFAEIYATAYSHYSMATHALLQPLFRYVGPHPDGGVFVGHEGNDSESTPWSIGLIVYTLGLLVAAEALGWPNGDEVHRLFLKASRETPGTDEA